MNSWHRYLGAMPRIRPYRDSDEASLRDICISTVHFGEDGRPHYRDVEMLPEIFAVPYVRLCPELAYVVDDGSRAVGYIVGTADTRDFVARFRGEWLPSLAERYPPLTGPPATGDRDEFMRELLYTPERMVLPELDAYPAHLHIDLLPGHQRSGFGRALIGTFVDALRARGVPGLHLAMVTENVAARAFYDRLGFEVIDVPEPGNLTYLGMRL